VEEGTADKVISLTPTVSLEEGQKKIEKPTPKIRMG
jgi:hypothetical protein